MPSNGTNASVGFKRALTGLALIAATLAIPQGCNQEVGGLGVNIKLDERTLSNGLKVIMVENHTIPIVSYQTWYRVGSVDEKPGQTGIAHFFEHLMFKGTEKYGAKQFFEQLEAKGAEVNAYTTRDYTVYYENFVPDLLEKVIDMESDRMENLKITEEVVNSERMVVFEERRLRTDNSPDGKIQEALWSLAYRVHPYSWPVIGYPQDLMSETVDQLKEFFKSHYQPKNAAVVIVGDFDANKTYDLLKKYYGPLEGRAVPKRNIPKEPEQNEERQKVLTDRTASQRMAQAYHVPSATDDDSFALDVLANILFEGSSSRAYRRLVEEKDIAVGVSGSAFTPTYPGLFIITATMKGNLPAELAQKELDRLYAEVQEKEVSEDEIKAAVKQLTVQLVDGVRTPYGLGQLIGTVQTILGDPTRYSEDLQKYTRITAKDVKRVAQKYLVPNNRSVVVMVPGVPKGEQQQ